MVKKLSYELCRSLITIPKRHLLKVGCRFFARKHCQRWSLKTLKFLGILKVDGLSHILPLPSLQNLFSEVDGEELHGREGRKVPIFFVLGIR